MIRSAKFFYYSLAFTHRTNHQPRLCYLAPAFNYCTRTEPKRTPLTHHVQPNFRNSPKTACNKITTMSASEQNVDNNNYVFPPSPRPTVRVASDVNNRFVGFFPVHRIYCVAKNYVDHVKEMGGDPIRDPPCFFTKPADAVVNCDDNVLTKIPYPLKTNNLHYEIELVIAIGKNGIQIPIDKATEHIYGFAVGCDLTRRDLQAVAKDNGRPWDSSKAFDRSAPIGYIIPFTGIHDGNDTNFEFSEESATNIWLDVNGVRKQSGTIQQMIWNIPEIISFLSNEFELQAGDLIFTGTPSGIGPIKKGDTVQGGIDGLGQLAFHIV